jgi:uncharacterized protein (UPF0332 family)
MNEDFRECLSKNKLVKFPLAKTFMNREIEESKRDLESTEKCFNDQNYKWATIQAYFSMFHSARSLIYKEGYREKSHFCLIAALKTLYLNKGLINHKIIEDIQLGKRMREAADYHADFSIEGAEALIKSAQNFLSIIGAIIKEKKG